MRLRARGSRERGRGRAARARDGRGALAWLRFFQQLYSTRRDGSYRPGPCVFVCTAPEKNTVGERRREVTASSGEARAMRAHSESFSDLSQPYTGLPWSSG